MTHGTWDSSGESSPEKDAPPHNRVAPAPAGHSSPRTPATYANSAPWEPSAPPLFAPAPAAAGLPGPSYQSQPVQAPGGYHLVPGGGQPRGLPHTHFVLPAATHTPQPLPPQAAQQQHQQHPAGGGGARLSSHRITDDLATPLGPNNAGTADQTSLFVKQRYRLKDIETGKLPVEDKGKGPAAAGGGNSGWQAHHYKAVRAGAGGTPRAGGQRTGKARSPYHPSRRHGHGGASSSAAAAGGSPGPSSSSGGGSPGPDGVVNRQAATPFGKALGRGLIRVKGTTRTDVYLPSPIRRQLKRDLGYRRTRDLRTWHDLSKWLVPLGRGRFYALFTYCCSVAMVLLFFYMAAQYGWWQVARAAERDPSGSVVEVPMEVWDAAAEPGPDSIPGILAFWNAKLSGNFDFYYLLAWGGRYAPNVSARREVWRWLSSIFIHQSFNHLLSNIVLFIVLAGSLEPNYGLLRIATMFVLSGLAGCFCSAAFENPCTLVVGASGSVFGFIGLYIADILLNFESMMMPLVRFIAMVLALVFLFVLQATDKSKAISHASHAGGLTVGLFVSFLFIPNLRDRRWRAARKFAAKCGMESLFPARRSEEYRRSTSIWSRYPIWWYVLLALGVLVALVFFVIFPIYIYLRVFPNMQCAPVSGRG